MIDVDESIFVLTRLYGTYNNLTGTTKCPPIDPSILLAKRLEKPTTYKPQSFYPPIIKCYCEILYPKPEAK